MSADLDLDAIVERCNAAMATGHLPVATVMNLVAELRSKRAVITDLKTRIEAARVAAEGWVAHDDEEEAARSAFWRSLSGATEPAAGALHPELDFDEVDPRNTVPRELRKLVADGALGDPEATPDG